MGPASKARSRSRETLPGCRSPDLQELRLTPCPTPPRADREHAVRAAAPARACAAAGLGVGLVAAGARARAAEHLQARGQQRRQDRQPGLRLLAGPDRRRRSSFVVVAYVVWKFRERKGHEPTAEAGPRQHQRSRSSGRSRRRCSSPSSPCPRSRRSSTSPSARPDALEVNVVGQQWWWEFNYPSIKNADGQAIVTANEMVIPAGKHVELVDHQPRRHPLVLDPEPQRQARRRARTASSRCAWRPTSPASTGASAPSSAACPTPTCACGWWP